MEKRPVSGMIPLFLSGMGDRGGACRSRTAPLRRLLLVSSGKSPALSSVNRVLAMGLGRHRAAVNLYQIQDQSKDVSAFDGMIMGIAPDGTGRTERALAFLRNHMDLFSAMPVALFFLLGDLPDFSGRTDFFSGLEDVAPLEVRIFQAPGIGLREEVLAWATKSVWPMMETAWLADLLFPGPEPCEPVLADRPEAVPALI